MNGRVAGVLGLGMLLVVAAVAAGAWLLWGYAGGESLFNEQAARKTPSYPTTQLAVESYLKAWEEGRFQDMHAVFTAAAQAAMPLDKFVERMKQIHAEATIQKVTGTVAEHDISPTSENPDELKEQQAKAVVRFTTGAVGDFTEELAIKTLKDASGDWRIAWTPDALFRDLDGNRLVRLFHDQPQRGKIVDRQGVPLGDVGSVISIGVVPAWMEDKDQTIDLLARTLSLNRDALKEQINAASPDWYLFLKALPNQYKAEMTKAFGTTAGVVVREEGVRGYPHGALASNVVGYVSEITAADLETLAAKGYAEGDHIGRAGIEQWGEEYLAGKPGGRLTIINTDGQILRTIKERAAEHGATIVLAIDANVQRLAESVLGDRVGSIVVMDPRDNTLLAVATGPRFDPNGFVRGWGSGEWQQLNNDPRHPFQNRPALSTYPSGSVFKVITMAAGMERGGFTANSRFNCTGRWAGLPGPRGQPSPVFADWIPSPGHGPLNLTVGLAQSCDIVFYEIAKKLDALDAQILAQFARGFGLGVPTGVVGMLEAGGIVPDHDWKMRTLNDAWYSGDSVNLGIGQGYLETTPLQITNAYAGIARGGEMKTPLLVDRIVDPDGKVLRQLMAEPRAPLPVSNATLATIKDSLKLVAGSPVGTAYSVFLGSRAPVAAKSGTAENQDVKNTHAWFVAYAPADAPQVVVTVMLEQGGMGGRDAGPLARRVLDGLVK